MPQTATITWTPVNNETSTGQEIQYKKPSDGTWTVAGAVSKTVSTATINGLLDNTLYLFRIVNVCSTGGPTPGIANEKITFICPAVTLTEGSDNVVVSFSHVGGDVDQYTVDLRNEADTTTLASQLANTPSGTITKTFSGLTAATNYKIRITTRATGIYNTYTRVCPSQAFITDPAPACEAPTNITVTLQ